MRRQPSLVAADLRATAEAMRTHTQTGATRTPDTALAAADVLDAAADLWDSVSHEATVPARVVTLMDRAATLARAWRKEAR